MRVHVTCGYFLITCNSHSILSIQFFILTNCCWILYELFYIFRFVWRMFQSLVKTWLWKMNFTLMAVESCHTSQSVIQSQNLRSSCETAPNPLHQETKLNLTSPKKNLLIVFTSPKNNPNLLYFEILFTCTSCSLLHVHVILLIFFKTFILRKFRYY